MSTCIAQCKLPNITSRSAHEVLQTLAYNERLSSPSAQACPTDTAIHLGCQHSRLVASTEGFRHVWCW